MYVKQFELWPMWQWTNHFEPTLGVAQTNSLGRHLLDEVTTSDISSCSAFKLKRKKEQSTSATYHLSLFYRPDSEPVLRRAL